MQIIPFLIAINTLFSFEPGLLPAICSAESDFRNIINKDDGGSPSYGICQIKLSTAQMMMPWVTSDMLMDRQINGFAAALYIEWQSKRYDKLECIISSYNAGRCIKSNQDTYVKKVKKRMKKYVGTKP